MKRFLLTVMLVLLPTLCLGEGKVYTKKARLESYAARTTRIVLPGDTVIDGILQQEVPSIWRINPYEFCTEEEYEQQKSNPKYFFLRVVEKSDKEDIPGVLCLYLSKGGSSDRESIDSAFDVIQLPVASSDAKLLSPLEQACFPAFLDIIQQYVMDAASSSFVAGAGLASYPLKPALEKNGVLRLVADPEEAVEMLENFEMQGAVAIIVGPTDQCRDATYYHMVIGTDNHKLYSFFSRKGAFEFSPSEMKLLSK